MKIKWKFDWAMYEKLERQGKKPYGLFLKKAGNSADNAINPNYNSDDEAEMIQADYKTKVQQLEGGEPEIQPEVQDQENRLHTYEDSHRVFVPENSSSKPAKSKRSRKNVWKICGK